jgi:CRISPR system Cascade subunit CasB
MTDTAPDIGKLASGWWHSALSDTTGQGRMARARLRRCNNAAAALAIEATHTLHAALGGGLTQRAHTLALLAIALANVRENHQKSAPERMGETLAALRFQALIRTENPADLIPPLRRALAQIDHAANVAALARDLYWWSEKTRSRWTFAYYGAALPATTFAEDLAK